MMDSMEKGKKAEKIVSDLFKEAGFKVVKYGYEYTVKELADKNNPIKGMAGQYIRHMPDFVVINKRNEAFFVEVKFRSYKIEQKDIFPYPDCYVILLTKDHILAQSTRAIYLRGYDFTYLNKMPPFKDIPVEITAKHAKKLRRVLGDETLSGQILRGIATAITGDKTLFKPPAKPRTGYIKGNKTPRKPVQQKPQTRRKGKGDVRGQKKRWNSRQKDKKRASTNKRRTTHKRRR